jgi:hypothetical protein
VSSLADTAPAFVAMAHRIVWASVATVDRDGRPRTRILHPIWEWDGDRLAGWIATSQTPIKRSDLAAHPDVSVSYWTTNHDTCSADCRADWALDDGTRVAVWDRFLHGPEPVGYDPAIVPVWKDGPTSDGFAVLVLTPRRLRVMDGTRMLDGSGDLFTWRAP